jgi:tetratricopeptide repeat protein 21B
MIAAKSKLIMGNMNGALSSLQKALEYDPKNEEAHILYAIIVYSNGNYDAAYSSIKEALANNFDIDKNPFFMLIKGQIEFESKKVKEGLKTLKKAYELPGVQDPTIAKEIQQNRFMTVIEFNENIRAQIFVYYAKALAQAKQNKLAKDVMEAAIMEFAGTEDEPVVLLGNADIAILSSDLKKAISILKNVEPNTKGYMEARKKLADIYLNHMMQRRQYAKCYQDLADTFPTFENLKLYGDALMRIQEPHDAIDAYQRALVLDPENEHMRSLIGKAMSTTHDYQATNDYYEQVITDYPKNLNMKIDYAKLLVKNNHLDVSHSP